MQPSIGALIKDVLKICSKFTGGHPCRSVISIKLLYNFIEIILRHGCSPVNFLHIFRTHFQIAPMEVGFWTLRGISFFFQFWARFNKSLRWSRTFYWAHQFRPLSNLVKTCVKMEIWMASELNFYRLIYFRLDWLFCQIQNHKVFFYSVWFMDAMIRLMILIWVIDENIH